MRANIDRFKGPVCEPARLTVFVKDQKLVDLVEGPIGLGVFRVCLTFVLPFAFSDADRPLVPQTFLFELQEDYDFMMHEVNDKRQADGSTIRINGAQIDPGKTRGDYPNAMSPQQAILSSVSSLLSWR
jgi:hypothetical protein